LCTVPAFDARLPAGTEFVMAFHYRESGWPLQPALDGPPRAATPSLITGFEAPSGQVCTKAGRQLRFEGFFLPSHLYFCALETSTPDVSLHQVINERRRRPLSATVLECPLPGDWYPPKVVDTIVVSRIHVRDVTRSVFRGPMVAEFNVSFTMARTCDDVVPPPSEDWTRAIVGTGVALTGVSLLGMAAGLVAVIWVRQRGGGTTNLVGGQHVYNQLVDGDELLERGKTHDVSLPLE
jgi:hypothetical protein